jgi:hypothetical protein
MEAYLYLSSNSTCSICCEFVVQQVVQQIHNFFDKSTTSRHVKTLWIFCGLNNKSTTNRNNGVLLSTCPQQVEKLCKKSTANPQQIEQVEYEPNTVQRLLSLTAEFRNDEGQNLDMF